MGCEYFRLRSPSFILPFFTLSRRCVSLQEMDKRFHNGQGFLYKVSLREAGGTNVHWNVTDVQAPPLVVHNTGTYRPFEIKVQAVNALGAGPEPESEIGHSGEDSTSQQTNNRTVVLYERPSGSGRRGSAPFTTLIQSGHWSYRVLCQISLM